MRRVRTIVARSDGAVQFVPFRELWRVAGTLVDTFPLDRRLVRGPRGARRLATCARLALVDRAVTNPEHTALLTLSETPWVSAVTVAVLAALVVPRLPRWARVGLFATLGGWIIAGRRGSRFLAFRRQLGHRARHAVLVSDFVASEPGAGMRWVADALEKVGPDVPFVVLVPASGDDRRDAARERLYVRQLGFQRVAEANAGGQQTTILVRA